MLRTMPHPSMGEFRKIIQKWNRGLLSPIHDVTVFGRPSFHRVFMIGQVSDFRIGKTTTWIRCLRNDYALSYRIFITRYGYEQEIYMRYLDAVARSSDGVRELFNVKLEGYDRDILKIIFFELLNFYEADQAFHNMIVSLEKQ